MPEEALDRRVTGRCRHGTVEACIPAEETMNDLPLRPADIGAVEDRFFTLRNFPLADGTVMPEATIAYETYGRLAAPNGPNGGRNAILCTHGYTASHHFAGRSPANGNQPGSWDGLIGPGKAIDTDKLFVVASNMLGSSFGSTNAGNINPQTGEAYGPDFANITIRDIVAAQLGIMSSSSGGQPRRVKAVHAGSIAAGDLGLFVVRHPGQDLRQDLPRLGKCRLAVRIVRAPHHVVDADDVSQANADGVLLEA
jgi:hypothetical protein